MNTSTPSYFYPNKIGRILLLSLEEIVGNNGINAILNHTGLSYLINNYPPNNLESAFKFDNVSLLQKGLEELYGTRGGCGLALRSGRTCFKYGLREFGNILGVSQQAFKLLSLNNKINNGAAIFAKFFNEFSDQKVHIENKENKILWAIDRCPICWERQAEHPVCHLAVGVLQEALFWVSGGKFFDIEETECVAQGHSACIISINTQPLN